jgi:UDP-N-acetylglucosamine:LPS N-acetylglucosamine transferase
MKIALVCSQGGHLVEMTSLIHYFKGHDLFFLTYDTPTTQKLEYRKYLIDNIGKNINKMLKAFIETFKILLTEKPDLIISTGAEIAIPVFIIGKIMMIRTIYIESWCRIKSKSGTGRLLYFISNIFLVQWPNLIKIYGKRARFKGAVI